jgi:hypothetical protein
VVESGRDDLKHAVKAYEEFMQLRVIRLSRMNMNIKSLELWGKSEWFPPSVRRF